MYAPAAPSSQASRPFLVQRIHAATATSENADISSSARAEIQSTAMGCALGVIANASVARPAASGLPSTSRATTNASPITQAWSTTLSARSRAGRGP